MSTYNEVLSQIQALALGDQLRFLEELQTIISLQIEVEEDNETISDEEIEENETAWRDYLAGKDLGISSKELKHWVLGEKFIGLRGDVYKK